MYATAAVVDAQFNSIVDGIEELESLEAPGWWNPSAAAWGAVFAGAVVGGIALT